MPEGPCVILVKDATAKFAGKIKELSVLCITIILLASRFKSH